MRLRSGTTGADTSFWPLHTSLVSSCGSEISVGQILKLYVYAPAMPC